MDNQHRKISGYRELNQEEVDQMNRVKEVAKDVGALVEDMGTMDEVDKRWLAIGTTELQKGFMSLTRSVAKPGFF